MAVTTAFLSKVKTALRVSYTDTAIDNQISDLIDEAILDLTETADIKTFTSADADALQTGAVIAYVQYKWYDDEKFFTIYNDQKTKMALAGKYRSVMRNEE
jgi:hypothetical protein